MPWLDRGQVHDPGYLRFERAHITAGMADAFVTVSLAGSLFFSVSPDASRRQVLVYLVATLIPFAVIAPLIGPSIDRFRKGHRWMAVGLYLARAGLAVALAFSLYDVTFYVLALLLLVANRASGVLRQALIPGLVDDPDRLIAANSQLAWRGTVAAGAAGGAAAAIVNRVDPAVPLLVAGALFCVAAMFATRIPRPRDAGLPTEREVAVEIEYEETHRPQIVAAAAAYTVIRAAVGAFVFGTAFALRRASEPVWMYGLALFVYGAGAFLGNVIAPRLRQRAGEHVLIGGSLLGLAICAAFGAIGASRALVLVVAVVMGGATTIGRQGFDSLVQRQAPLAVHGRSFSRFETQFQLGWVVGAVIATAVVMSTTISLAMLAVLLVPAAVFYLRSARQALRFGFAIPDAATSTTVGSVAEHRLADAERWLVGGEPRLAA
ncbi:MAG TPA: MFS transporter, partial [Ilumatobacteraceae bacterium]